MWQDEEDPDEKWLDIPYVDEDERDEDLALLEGGPGEHDAYLTAEDYPFRTVPCGNCGKPVWEEAQACRRCGYHFSDQAYNDRTSQVARTNSRLLVIMILLLILAMAMAGVLGVRYF